MQNKQTKKEIRIAIRCHRITTALHSSQATDITYIKREVIINLIFLILYLIKLQEVSLNDVIVKE